MDYRAALSETLGVLRTIATDYRPAVLANAFGPESMVMTDLIVKHELDIGIFSIDTGRLPEETHALAHSVHRRYGHVIEMVNPDDAVVAERNDVQRTVPEAPPRSRSGRPSTARTASTTPSSCGTAAATYARSSRCAACWPARPRG